MAAPTDREECTVLYSPLIRTAMQIACRAHAGQTDKAGYPYLHHPLHLADLKHNSDLSRLDEVTPKALERVQKYAAMAILSE